MIFAQIYYPLSISMAFMVSHPHSKRANWPWQRQQLAAKLGDFGVAKVWRQTTRINCVKWAN